MNNSLASLRTFKNPFLDSVESQIRIYIEGQGENCIAIVEKNSDGSPYYTWQPCLDPGDLADFCKVLYKFVRHKQHHNHDLDSALTEPVCQIVVEKYETFYKDNSKAISAGLLHKLAGDELLLKSFVGRIADVALEKASAHVRNRVVHLVAEQIHDSAANGALHTIGHQVSQVAATTAGTSVATVVAHILMKLLASHIAAVVTHLLSSALVHKLVLLMVKKVVIAAVGTAVLNFLAVHVGAAVGGSTIMWIVAPLLVVYIGYKIATFPEKIGKEVGKSVRKELSDRFDGMNQNILEKISYQVFNGDELVLSIAKDKEFQEMLKSIAKDI